jgi:prepilin-type processing-associated H-X9-DG protein
MGFSAVWDSATPLVNGTETQWHFDGSDYLGPATQTATQNITGEANGPNREPDPLRHYHNLGNILFMDGHVAAFAHNNTSDDIQAGWVRYDNVNKLRTTSTGQ